MDIHKNLLAGSNQQLCGAIGIPGQQGFGVGQFGGSADQLQSMGLTPLPGCDDPSHENYGNYQHTNQSIMCCVPAFVYRLGNPSAPSYSRDGANALEVKDASEFPQFEHNKAFVDGDADFGDGWILHRAFIDGGKMKNCFFMDKYLCSNNGSNQAASIKNADWLMCTFDNVSYTTKYMGGDGKAYDAITFSRARGDHYSLTTVYQWSAMSMLSLAHGQATNSNLYCAWHDPTYTTNFPKGATKVDINCADYNDSSVAYNAHSLASFFAKTGSSNQPAKVSHNGQLCGIMDVAGMCQQLCIGATNNSRITVGLMKLSVSAHDFMKDNRVDDNLHETFDPQVTDGRFFGLRNGKSGTADWAACGVIPASSQDNIYDENSCPECALFGNDEYRTNNMLDLGLKMALGCTADMGGYQFNAGIFCRSFWGYGTYGDTWGEWDGDSQYYGFRASGYAP